jgi:hypothetical protein
MLVSSRTVRAVLKALGAIYLAGVWLDGVGSNLPAKVLPRTLNYFMQIAALFPKAALMSIDYRVEGWVCADQKWEELDARPYFPIDPDDKENRFQRVMHFFRDHRPTMQALDAYLVASHNAGKHADGIAEDRAIGGIRTQSLRIPLPKPGDPLTRPVRRPLASYPEEQKAFFYHTKKSKLAERCGRVPHRDDDSPRGPDEGD